MDFKMQPNGFNPNPPDSFKGIMDGMNPQIMQKAGMVVKPQENPQSSPKLMMNPQIMAESQKTFVPALSHSTEAPSSPSNPKGGTAPVMTPPGWSSKATEGK